jgi:hypothetical protein
MTGIRPIALPTSDGLTLEGEISPSDGDVPARAAVVLCHPHPQYGGTMRSIVISALFEALPGHRDTRVRRVGNNRDASRKRSVGNGCSCACRRLKR